MIVDCDAADIVYSNFFTGIHGNYLKPSIDAAGLDPDALPQPIPRRWISTAQRRGRRPGRTSGAAGQGIGAVRGGRRSQTSSPGSSANTRAARTAAVPVKPVTPGRRNCRSGATQHFAEFGLKCVCRCLYQPLTSGVPPRDAGLPL